MKRALISLMSLILSSALTAAGPHGEKAEALIKEKADVIHEIINRDSNKIVEKGGTKLLYQREELANALADIRKALKNADKKTAVDLEPTFKFHLEKLQKGLELLELKP